MEFQTRQDHIDPLIQSVGPCSAHRTLPGQAQETVVMFTSGEWVCSSGHVSNLRKIPRLRSPELDPEEWCRVNFDKVARQLPSKICDTHAPGGGPTTWIPDGHIWMDSEDHMLKLCQPRLA